MDLATIIGLVLGAGLTLFGILSGGASILDYCDLPSAIITFGGCFSCLLTSHTLKDYLNSFKSVRLAFKTPAVNNGEMIKNIIDLSNIARKEGLLSLEEAASELEEPFLKKGILLVVDGTDPDLVRGILETEIISVEERHKSVIGFWDMMASMGPAWGMIGTLIGLVAMLNDMSDPNAIGPAMAVALITTLYGSLLANWIATPLANKLRVNNAAELQQKEVMIEGLLSIQAGENPRVIEEKLKAFMAPKDRENGDMDNEGGGDE